MQRHGSGHHDVGVQAHSLISDKDLFEVHKGGQPSIFLSLFVGCEYISPGTELDCDIVDGVISGLKVHRIDNVISQYNSISANIKGAGNYLKNSKGEVRVGVGVSGRIVVEVDHKAAIHDCEGWSYDREDGSVVCIDLGIGDVPGSVYIMDSAIETIFNLGSAGRRKESPMGCRLPEYSQERLHNAEKDWPLPVSLEAGSPVGISIGAVPIVHW